LGESAVIGLLLRNINGAIHAGLREGALTGIPAFLKAEHFFKAIKILAEPLLKESKLPHQRPL
jgi:hypothetical protein